MDDVGTRASIGQVLLGMAAIVVLLGGGALVASATVADSATSVGIASSTTSMPSSTTSTSVAGSGEATPPPTTPTCAQIEELAARQLWSRAVVAFDASTDANVACSPSLVERARAEVERNTQALVAAAALRRSGDPSGARQMVEEAAARDVSDRRPAVVLQDLDEAERDLAVIDRLEAAGLHDEAEAALQTFVTEHPDARPEGTAADVAQSSAPTRIADWFKDWAVALVPIVVGLLIAWAFVRTLIARWSRKRLILAPITVVEVPASDGGGEDTKAVEGKGGSTPEGGGKGSGASVGGQRGTSGQSTIEAGGSNGGGRNKKGGRKRKQGEAMASPVVPSKDAPAPPGTVGAPAPSVVETLIIEQLNRFRSESVNQSPRIATGPDGAIDLPAPDKLPTSFAFVSALSIVLPKVRGYSVTAALTHGPEVSNLALRLIQGQAEHGKLKKGTVIGSSASSQAGRERELAAKAAAWIAFTWSDEMGMDPPLRMGGTASWVSYAHFASGLSFAEQENSSKAVEYYTKALRMDAGNVNALVNLAGLLVESDPALAVRFGKRAIQALGDSWSSTARPTICCQTYPWHQNWYRATSHVATALLNDRQRRFPATSERGRGPVREAKQAIERVLETIEHIRSWGMPPRRPLPAGVGAIGPGFLEFLDNVRLNLGVLRVVALVELGSAPAEVREAIADLPPLHPHASFNLACALARSSTESQRLQAFAHLAEAHASFGEKIAAEPALAGLRTEHPRLWRRIFGPAAASGGRSARHPEASPAALEPSTETEPAPAT